jgi:hypothetical protein
VGDEVLPPHLVIETNSASFERPVPNGRPFASPRAGSSRWRCGVAAETPIGKHRAAGRGPRAPRPLDSQAIGFPAHCLALALHFHQSPKSRRCWFHGYLIDRCASNAPEQPATALRVAASRRSAWRREGDWHRASDWEATRTALGAACRTRTSSADSAGTASPRQLHSSAAAPPLNAGRGQATARER